MKTKILEDIGLTKGEANIYLILLELGSTTAGPIIKKSGFHRATAYTVLQRLVEKGFVSYLMKGNIKYYQPLEPKRIIDLLHEKEHRVKETIPELELMQKFGQEQQKATVFEGDAGVRVVFDMILKELKTGDEHLSFGASGGRSENWIEYFDNFSRKLRSKGVKERLIFNENAFDSIKNSVKINVSVKVLSDKYITPTSIDLFHNKTAMVIWTRRPLAFLIESEEFADSFRNYFELLWSIAKSVEKDELIAEPKKAKALPKQENIMQSSDDSDSTFPR